MMKHRKIFFLPLLFVICFVLLIQFVAADSNCTNNTKGQVYEVSGAGKYELYVDSMNLNSYAQPGAILDDVKFVQDGFGNYINLVPGQSKEVTHSESHTISVQVSTEASTKVSSTFGLDIGKVSQNLTCEGNLKIGLSYSGSFTKTYSVKDTYTFLSTKADQGYTLMSLVSGVVYDDYKMHIHIYSVQSHFGWNPWPYWGFVHFDRASQTPIAEYDIIVKVPRVVPQVKYETYTTKSTSPSSVILYDPVLTAQSITKALNMPCFTYPYDDCSCSDQFINFQWYSVPNAQYYVLKLERTDDNTVIFDNLIVYGTSYNYYAGNLPAGYYIATLYAVANGYPNSDTSRVYIPIVR